MSADLDWPKLWAVTSSCECTGQGCPDWDVAVAEIGRQIAAKIESELSDATAQYRAANSDRAGTGETVAYWSGREDALRDISVDVREWTGADHLPESEQ